MMYHTYMVKFGREAMIPFKAMFKNFPGYTKQN